MLLVGLMILAAAEVVDATRVGRIFVESQTGWLTREGIFERPVLSDLVPILVTVGSVLVGLGLLGLFPAARRRLRILALLVMLSVAPTMGSYALALMRGQDALLYPIHTGIQFLELAAAAFAAWAAVVAWLARADPRRFWTLLAAAVPLHLIRAGSWLIVDLTATPIPFDGPAAAALTLTAIAPAATALLALVAFAVYAPITGQEGDSRTTLRGSLPRSKPL